MSHFFHSSWLRYKMYHGLAQRGRTTECFRCQPLGIVAHVLYYLYFRWNEHGKETELQTEDN